MMPEVEYRLEMRYRGDHQWHPGIVLKVFKGDGGRLQAVQELARQRAGSSPAWEYRLAKREVTDWEPVDIVSEADRQR